MKKINRKLALPIIVISVTFIELAMIVLRGAVRIISIVGIFRYIAALMAENVAGGNAAIATMVKPRLSPTLTELASLVGKGSSLRGGG